MSGLTFVLVHGGRHGGWCWRFVAPLLRAAGHDVVTPTLTGLGERAHLLAPTVGLDTHVQDLVSVFEYEDITDAVLVAHSYGGLVAGAALEHVADRVKHVVFLDAQLPRTGDRMLDMTPPPLAEQLVALVERDGEGWYVPPADASWWGVEDPEVIAWMNPRITAQPFQTYRDRAGVVEQAWRLPGTFVECTPSMLSEHMLARARGHAAEATDFDYRVLDTCHDAMATDPVAVADLLLDVGASVYSQGLPQRP